MYRVLTILFCICNINICVAQNEKNSPYSRFGLGDLNNISFSEYASLGGATAFSNSSSINPYNPATYSSFLKNSFLLSTGIDHQNIAVYNKDKEDGQVNNNTAFSHFAFAFRLNNRFGASMGMLPYSDMNYNLTTFDNYYNADLVYSGDGGISKMYFGIAYKLSEFISIGVNASYLFGTLNQRKKILYRDNSFLNSRQNNSFSLKGYTYEIGLLYNKLINKDQEISFGLNTSNNALIKTKRSQLLETFEYTGLVEYAKDTVLNIIQSGDLYLPKFINIGAMYKRSDNWIFIVDYSMQDWSEYQLFDQNSDDLINSSRASAGMQYIPEPNSITKYYKRFEYRFGFSHENTPIYLNNNQLQETGIYLGLGMPVKKNRTKYNFLLALSERGTTEGNLIKERIFKIGLQISFNGIWFKKYKYD